MLRVEHVTTYGMEEAIRGMRNPYDSWDRSDSVVLSHDAGDSDSSWSRFIVGDGDMKLMKKLFDAGTEHRKFMRMVVVYMDITAPLYWWKEFDTYKVGTVANSCSTMHTLMRRPLKLSDFSTEMLPYGSGAMESLLSTIRVINELRSSYLAAEKTDERKALWYQVIQLLPTSYNQRRTVMMDYEVCARVIEQRSGHKLDEWRELIKVMKEKLVKLDDLTS